MGNFNNLFPSKTRVRETRLGGLTNKNGDFTNASILHQRKEVTRAIVLDGRFLHRKLETFKNFCNKNRKGKRRNIRPFHRYFVEKKARE